MPWNPEHYKVKKLLPVERFGDFRDDIVEEDWWERHKRYIEHRKEFPYDPDKNDKKTS